jgi:hypothetical protein
MCFTPDQLRDLAKKTDIRSLISRMEELPEPPPQSVQTPTEDHPRRR